MIGRILKFGIPAAGALELVLVGGAAYFTWEHDQGRHDQPQLTCPICWMDKIVPVAESPGRTPAAQE